MLIKSLSKIMIFALVMLLFAACSNDKEAVETSSDDETNWEKAEYGLKELDDVIMVTEYDEYEEGTTEVMVTWINDFCDTMMFGERYSLEKKVDNIWRKVEKETDIIYTFTDIGYIMEPNTEKEHLYDLICFTDGLNAGRYRISATFYRETLNGNDLGAGNYPEFQLYAYFTVKSNAEN